MSRRVFVLANPTAGRGKTARALPTITSALKDKGLDFSLHNTTGQGTVQGLLQKHLNASFTEILVVGGDGTFHELINALPHFDLPIGLIQSGTGNDFIKALDGGKSLRHQLDRALMASAKPIDLGICNGKLFHNGVGIGFDGQVANRAAELKGKGGSVWSYYQAIAEALFSYKGVSMHLEAQDESREGMKFMTTIANGVAFGGGLKVTPKASITDGLLDVCEVNRLSVAGRLWRLPFLVAGKHAGLPKINYFKTQEITISGPNEMPAHIDGEVFGAKHFQIGLSKHKLLLRH